MNKPNTPETMEALLEMIEPSGPPHPYNGGSVSYETAAEFYGFAMEYIKKLEEALDRAVSGMDDTSLNGLSKYKASSEYEELARFKKEQKIL